MNVGVDFAYAHFTIKSVRINETPDFFIALLTSLSASKTKPLQMIHNAAAHMLITYSI